MPTRGRVNGLLRLVLVTETFPPEVNGVARALERWVTTFQQRGHRVVVIRPRQSREPPGPNRVLGLPLPLYPQLRFGIASPWRIGQMLRRTRPDLVHVATEGLLGLAALSAARELAIPVATSFHTNFDHYLTHYGLGILQAMGSAYLRWFHNQTALTLVPSAGTRQRLDELGFQRVDVWSRGVDSYFFHPRHRDRDFRAQLGLRPQDLLLLYVGRLAPEKNLPALIDAFVRLRHRLSADQRDRLWLALVGDGPLTDRIRSMRLPRLLLAGFHTGQALARWYASADLFAFPSLSETFGNVILEAMASGLPVVAYDYPQVRERITHGHDGLIAAIGDCLSGSLEHLCIDEGRRCEMGCAARQTALAQDWEPIFDQLEIRYRQLVHDHACRAPMQATSPLLG